MTRRFPHLVILGLLLGLPLLAGLGSGPPPARTPPLIGSRPPVASAAEASSQPGSGPLQGGSFSFPPAAAKQLRPAAQWVQAFRPTTLWTSQSPDAPSLTSLPQWTVFRQLGAQLGERLPVEYPGDGVAALPQRGWVTAADVGPSGPPSPHYELASGGSLSPITGRAVPRRTVQAWPQGISAQLAVLLDGDSGEVLWGRNAYGEVAPASLTKIVTAMLALERSRLSDRVTVQVDSRTMYESTVMGITPGENLSMETLLHGLMLPSGNDAAIAIAQHVAGSESRFVALMNAKAAELGLVNSRFANSHGLDASGHYTSPFDISTFSRVGMADPTFARVVSTRAYQAEGYALTNTNRLLQVYPRADGVKIGYTDAAGRAISASAAQDGHRLFAALIRSYNPIPEAQALLEWGFRGFSWDT